MFQVFFGFSNASNQTPEVLAESTPEVASGLVQFELHPLDFPDSLTYEQVFTDLMNVTSQTHLLDASIEGVSNHDTYVNGAFGRDALFLADEGSHYRVYISGYEGLVPKQGQEGSITRTINGITASITYTVAATYYPFPEQEIINESIVGRSRESVSELEFADQTLNYTSRELPDAKRITSRSSDQTANIPSYYMVQDGMLYRYLTTDVVAGRYQFFTGVIPEGVDLTPGVRYYSYDGVYFYDNIRHIRVDGTGAVNEENPYYNYYQYVPFRSTSTYTSADLEKYITHILTEGEQSALRGMGEHFQGIQDEFGINPALQLAFAIHESARGTSTLALNNNNLFGIQAIDSDPLGNGANFVSVEACISAHARDWISRYLYPTDWRYGGPHVGNKGSGMNMQYASDPYWGEKIAGWYYRLDSYLEESDANHYTIGILPTAEATNVTDKDGNRLYIAARNQNNPVTLRNFPFLILNEQPEHFQIRTDAPIVDGTISPEAAEYSRDQAIGYIPSSLNLVMIGKADDLRMDNELRIIHGLNETHMWSNDGNKWFRGEEGTKFIEDQIVRVAYYDSDIVETDPWEAKPYSPSVRVVHRNALWRADTYTPSVDIPGNNSYEWQIWYGKPDGNTGEDWTWGWLRSNWRQIKEIPIISTFEFTS